MKWEEYQKLPLCTPEVVIETAKKHLSVYGGEITVGLISKVIDELYRSEKYQTPKSERFTYTVWYVYQAELNPELRLFKNDRMQLLNTFVGKKPEPYWLVTRVLGEETTLADYRDMIAALIDKYGEHMPFHATSDQGDEYFNLRAGVEALKEQNGQPSNRRSRKS